MYTPIKNTLFALAIATSMVGFGYGLGEPSSAVSPPALTGAFAVTSSTQASVISADAATANQTRRSKGLKRHLAMPFISFSPLPSRRGV